MARHVVGNDGRRDAVVLQFPRGQPRSLQKRPGLVGKHVNLLSRRYRRTDHTECGDISRSGQSPRIAVSKNRFTVRHKTSSVAPDGFVDPDIFTLDKLSLGDEERTNLVNTGAARRLIEFSHAVDR